jgi:exopolyphosphatase / guanosine-5'-triphosphate,3'-diphosphate pyrophosphatase
MAPQRIAVLDLGTNSTRLLVADVEDGAVSELERRTTVTRLGDGVDATGLLSEAAIARVTETVAAYREVIDRLGATPRTGVAFGGRFRSASTSTPARSRATRRRG